MDNVQIHDIVRIKSLDDSEKNRLFGKYLGIVTKVRYLTRLAFVNFADLKLKQGIPWAQWFPFSDLEIYRKALPKATVRVLDGFGHFNLPELPVIIEDIKSL